MSHPLITAIGASAGGIQALQEFFEHTPANAGIAYVVLLHISPSHDSHLAEVLQQTTKMPVTQVQDKTHIEPDHVYVIPPDKHLTMEDDFIILSSNTGLEERRAPIDIFFRSLADVHRERAVGAVLSGTGADGSMGLKRIKENGGGVFVQNPREAEFNDMPRNAIATDLVDDVLNVADIPGRILVYRDTLAITRIEEAPEARAGEDQQALREIFTQLRTRTGHDFSAYKRATLMRRIERRMAIRGLTLLPDYAVFSAEHPEETQSLLKDLLISVTNFFRDKTPFVALEETILPTIFEAKTGEEEVRIWVAGCAPGEEAYSIAMLCAERTFGIMDAPKVQIFATDIDEAAIATAREGLYTINDAADVSAERLARFFTREGDAYRIRREIRESILFAQHNFLKNPPFSRIDLVSCRNVLIYLNRSAQERMMETYHFSLNTGGFMLLGTSESVDIASDLFGAFNREQHIYQSRIVTSLRSIVLPETAPELRTRPYPQPPEVKPHAPLRINYGDLHLQLLEQYAPPSLVVNAAFDIVHATPQAGRYLRIGGGEPTQAVLQLIRDELRSELRNGLYQAAQKGTPVNSAILQVRTGELVEDISIHVRPVLGTTEDARNFLLVVFERAIGDEPLKKLIPHSTGESATKHLEEELSRMRVQLRGSDEQHEFQAEELKAGNEELQAMNEELRSAAEELETSKEELQSINEELSTVNQELKVKVEEGSILSSNLQNIINSTDIGTIFLDRSLRVVLFTPAVRSLFNLIPADYSRPLSDITGKLDNTLLLENAALVLERLQTVEREAGTSDGRTLLIRLSPYRTEEDHIQGVVISFVDITERKSAEKALRAAEEWRKLILESAEDYAIFTLDPERRVSSWNMGAQNILGYRDEEILGKSGDIMFIPEDREDGAPATEAEDALTKGRAVNERWHLRKDDSRFWGSGLTHPLRDEGGTPIGFVKIMRDFTEAKRVDEALHESKLQRQLAIEAAELGTFVWHVQEDRAEPDARLMKMMGIHDAREVSFAHAIANVIHPEDRDAYAAEVQAALDPAGDGKFRAEARFIPAGGGACWLAGSRQTIFEGVPRQAVRMYGTFADINGRKRREANLAFLAEVSADLVQLTNVNNTMKLLCEKLGHYFSAALVGFSQVDEPAGTVTILQTWHRADAISPTGVIRIEDYHPEEVRELMRSGRPEIVHDTTTFPDAIAANMAALKIGAYVNMPLVRDGLWHLTLSITDSKPRDWRNDEIELMRELTARIWIRLESARTEEALRISETRARTLADAVPHVIWTNNADGFADYFNERWYAYTGFTYAQSEGLGWEAIVHPDDAIASKRRWLDALQNGSVFDTEYRLRSHDGGYRWFIGRNVPLHNDAGEVISWFGSATDIDDLKQAQTLLASSEQRLRVTTESALDYAIISMDTERLIQGWSRGSERIFGYTEEEIIGKRADIIFTPEDRAAMAPEYETETAREEGMAPDERWHLRKDGSRFYMSGVMRPIYNNGAIGGFVKVARDMTEHKEAEETLRLSEERYRAALQSAEMGAWDWDIAADSVVWNDQHYLILGLKPDGKAKDSSYFVSFVHPEDIGAVTAELGQAVEKVSLYRAEFRIIREDNGETRWMMGYGSAVSRDESGRATRMVGVMYDITARKRVEEQKEEFIGIASHELKTPLTSIKAYSEILQDMFAESGDRQSAKLMGKMEGQIDRLTALVRALLDVTRIREGKMELEKEHFELDTLLRELAEEMQRTTPIRLQMDDLSPTTVRADPKCITQVIVNLLSNAIKYSRGTEFIELSVRAEDGEAIVCVRDFGIGMSEEEKGQVFERFYRAQGATAGTYPGLGLGLYISGEIVRLHGGRIWVESEPGDGSTFCFTLPL